MKKFLFFLTLMVGLIIAGCSDDTKDQSGNGNNDSSNQQAETEQSSAEKGDKENKKKKLYEVGDTVQLHSGTYGFPFEVTVNSFKLTTNSIDGKALKDYGFNAKEGSFAVVNVTIKNTSKKAFIPKNKISAQILVDGLSINAEREFFQGLSKKLKPGKEITGNLVYLSDKFKEAKNVILAYEYFSPEETRWKLPNK